METTNIKYHDFIKSKAIKAEKTGFTPYTLNENLFDFQKCIVIKALEHGRYAIFAECGMGKTIMQLSWADEVVKYTNKPVLILCPLAVSDQTIREGQRFGIDVQYYRDDANAGVYIINYDQIDNVDASQFSGVVLDESSILKNFTGKLKNSIVSKFKQTPFRLACTATPSPNDPVEIGNHSEFLGLMSRNEMLAMYFVHDGGDTSSWRLKGYSANEFYGFIASWASVIRTPADIGFNSDAEKYKLPLLNYYISHIETPKQDNGLLFNSTSVNATDFNRQLKETIKPRMEKTAEIVNGSDETCIIWVNQDAEADYLKTLIPDAVEVRGSQSPDLKKKLLNDFANGAFKVLITKKKIAQFGMNFQNCHKQVFASLDFSFEGLYQSIRRSYRFGQKSDVDIYIIATDTMSNVLTTIQEKERLFNTMQKSLIESINHIEKPKLIRRETYKNDDCTAINGDCVQEIKNIADESIGFTVFSPPFSELYTYSDHPEDMGNSKDYDEFEEHFGYLVNDLYRVLKQGRNMAVHCMDLPIQKGKEGFIGLRDFSGFLIKLFEKAGFIYHSRVTIWKDPVVEMQRTKALGLLHKQVKKDSTMSRVGIPDYILIFRKDGDRVDPVTNTELSVDLWQKYASPVWYDINYGNTLNFRSARDTNDDKHICPLQLDTIERLVHLYSNRGDVVLSPFMGIGSEGFKSLEMGRKFIGIELKESYFDLAVKNLKAISENKQTSLFDCVGV
jgi:DNA modification methylase/superfamily II DNA or RNA helicase